MANYKNMRDSGVKWIGYAPSHWEILSARKSFVQSFEKGNTTPILLSASQKYGMCPQENLEGTVKVSEKVNLQDFKTVHKNDFVISLRSFQGGFERSDFEGVCSPAYQVFRAVRNYNNDYLKWLFKNSMFIEEINSITLGIREGKNIKYEDFTKVLLPVPPLAEQTAIAKYLDKVCAQIDDIIEETKKSAEDYKKLRLSAISEAVTGGLDKNAEMKDSGVEWIGKVPKGWKITRIKNVIKIENGSDPKNEGKIPVYGSGSESFKTCGEYKEGPTVLLGRKGATLHIPHYIEGRYWNVDTAFNTIVINDLIDLKYFYYLSFCFDYNSYMSQTTLPSMTQSNYSAMNIPYPPMNEQKAIAEYLDKKCAAIDEIIAEKENLITDLELYKKSLIYETVTGKRKAV